MSALAYLKRCNNFRPAQNLSHFGEDSTVYFTTSIRVRMNQTTASSGDMKTGLVKKKIKRRFHFGINMIVNKNGGCEGEPGYGAC